MNGMEVYVPTPPGWLRCFHNLLILFLIDHSTVRALHIALCTESSSSSAHLFDQSTNYLAGDFDWLSARSSLYYHWNMT